MSKRMPDFKFAIHQPVAWGDMDAFGHLNNVVYARYFESGRARFFSDNGFWADPGKPEKEGVILVRQELKYRKQVRFPATLQIRVGVLSASSRGFVMGCTMLDDAGDLCCEAEADLLWIDFTTGKPVRLPQKLRDLAGELL